MRQLHCITLLLPKHIAFVKSTTLFSRIRHFGGHLGRQFAFFQNAQGYCHQEIITNIASLPISEFNITCIFHF